MLISSQCEISIHIQLNVTAFGAPLVRVYTAMPIHKSADNTANMVCLLVISLLIFLVKLSYIRLINENNIAQTE